jgi:hypothetical protein
MGSLNSPSSYITPGHISDPIHRRPQSASSGLTQAYYNSTMGGGRSLGLAGPPNLYRNQGQVMRSLSMDKKNGRGTLLYIHQFTY